MGIIAHTARMIAQFPAWPTVPADGHYRLYANDGAGGDIDYDTPLTRRISPWPDEANRAGPGTISQFPGGVGPVGRGDGDFPDGIGLDGYGIFIIPATSGPLADGTYDAAVVAYDAAGNADVGPRTEDTVALAGVPAPSGVPEATDYDDQTDTLTLAFTLSGDDEGT